MSAAPSLGNTDIIVQILSCEYPKHLIFIWAALMTYLIISAVFHEGPRSHIRILLHLSGAVVCYQLNTDFIKFVLQI